MDYLHRDIHQIYFFVSVGYESYDHLWESLFIFSESNQVLFSNYLLK